MKIITQRRTFFGDNLIRVTVVISLNFVFFFKQFRRVWRFFEFVLLRSFDDEQRVLYEVIDESFADTFFKSFLLSQKFWDDRVKKRILEEKKNWSNAATHSVLVHLSLAKKKKIEWKFFLGRYPRIHLIWHIFSIPQN